MDDSQLDGAEDVVSIMESIITEFLSSSAFADDHKLLLRTKRTFKQSVRDEKKIRSSCEEEKRALEIEIAHSKAKLSEVKADCARLKAELSSVEEENARLEKDETERNAHIKELKREVTTKKIAQLRILKANSEANLGISQNEIRRLEMKIAARSAGEFQINQNQKLLFGGENMRIEMVE